MDENTQVFRKKNFTISPLFKKASFILALGVFAVAVIVATYFDKFVAKPESSQPNSKVEIKQFKSPDDFKAFLGSVALNSAVNSPDLKTIESPQKRSLFFSNLVAIPDLEFTDILDVSDPEDIQVLKELDKTGEIDEFTNQFVIVGGREVNAYSKSDLNNLWSIDFGENEIISHAAFGNELILAIKHRLTDQIDCPLPFAVGQGISITTPCDSIYYPLNSQRNFDQVTTIISVNTQNGGVDKRISFITGESSLVYLGQTSLITYPSEITSASDEYNFFVTEGVDILPPDIITDLQKMDSYGISEQAKLVELNTKLQSYIDSLPEDLKKHFISDLSTKIKESKLSPGSLRTLLVAVNPGNMQISGSIYIPGLISSKNAISTTGSKLYVVSNNIYGGNVINSTLNVLNTDLSSVDETQIEDWTYSVKPLGTSSAVVSGEKTFIVNINSNETNKVSDDESLLARLDESHILSVSGTQNTTSVKVITQEGNTLNFGINEQFSSFKNHFTSMSANPTRSLFFLPGGQNVYIFQYSDSGLGIFRTLPMTNNTSSTFSDKYLFISADDEIAILDLDSRIIIDREPLDLLLKK